MVFINNKIVFVVTKDPEAKLLLNLVLCQHGLIVSHHDCPKKFFHLLKSYDPTLIYCAFLDTDLGNTSGIELHQKMITSGHNMPVSFISSSNSVSVAVSSIKQGGIDFLQKPLSDKRVISAAKAMLNKSLLSQQITNSLKHANKLIKSLTNRESEVLNYVLLGSSNKKIAESLKICTKTVESYRISLVKKLKVKNTTELIAFIIRTNRLTEIESIVTHQTQSNNLSTEIFYGKGIERIAFKVVWSALWLIPLPTPA